MVFEIVVLRIKMKNYNLNLLSEQTSDKILNKQSGKNITRSKQTFTDKSQLFNTTVDFINRQSQYLLKRKDK
jgi:hypothetical protein